MNKAWSKEHGVKPQFLIHRRAGGISASLKQSAVQDAENSSLFFVPNTKTFFAHLEACLS